THLAGTTKAEVQNDEDNIGYPSYRSGTYPAGNGYKRIMIRATFSAGYYLYVQRWFFSETGDITAMVGAGGHLYPHEPSRAHVHSFYWRFDIDIDDGSNNWVQIFKHPNMKGNSDTWLPSLTTEDVAPPIGAAAKAFTKMRVRSNVKNAQNFFHSYEIRPRPEFGNVPYYSFGTTSMWAVRQHAGEDGTLIGGGTKCDDSRFTGGGGGGWTPYVNGENIRGKAGGVWAAVHEPHEPRAGGEEKTRMPGFHWVSVELAPRDFLDDTPAGSVAAPTTTTSSSTSGSECDDEPIA